MIVRPYSTSLPLAVLYAGAPLENGPLPALFYFALCAKKSLESPPFNYPVQFLTGLALRIFSITLPFHEKEVAPDAAMRAWEEEMKTGAPVASRFASLVKEVIEELSPWILDGKLATAGLSRGAYIACHVAAICPKISHILGFAPLTSFQSAKHLDLETLTPLLYNRALRFYIGNQDRRVGTTSAFSFIHHLASEANRHRIRSSPIELIIGPSIGYQGHGTALHTFKEGADWIKGALFP